MRTAKVLPRMRLLNYYKSRSENTQSALQYRYMESGQIRLVMGTFALDVDDCLDPARHGRRKRGHFALVSGCSTLV